MQRIIIGALAVLLCVSGAWAAWNHIQRSRLRMENDAQAQKLALQAQEIAVAQKTIAELNAKLDQASKQGSNLAGLEQLLKSGDGMKELMALLDEQRSAAGSSPSVTGRDAQAYGKSLGQLTRNPVFRDLSRTGSERMNERTYSRLFSKTNMTDAEMAQFLGTLRDRAESLSGVLAAQMEAGTPEERARLREQARAINQEAERRLAESLGAEKYAEYQLQTKVAPLQWSLMGLRMQPNNRPSDEQLNTLNQTLESVAGSFNYSVDLTSPEKVMAADVNDQTVAAYLAERKTLNDQITAAAATVLTPEQVATLTRSQEQGLNMVTRQLEIAKVAQTDPQKAAEMAEQQSGFGPGAPGLRTGGNSFGPRPTGTSGGRHRGNG